MALAWNGMEAGTMVDVFEALGEDTNVVRLPSERAARPLMDRVCDVEPDVRKVVLAAGSLGLGLPAADLRDRVDEETARHIAEQILPLAPAERRLALDGLLALVAAAALRACADASRASGRCAAALREVERAEVLSLEAGKLLVAAYQRCQEAHGVAWAVGLARREEVWTRCGAAETTAWLGECGVAQSA